MSVPNTPVATPQPQAPSVDERISQRAKAFVGEVQEDGPTNTLDPNPVEADADPPPQDAEATEQTEQEAETPAPPDVPMVEVELDDGEKVLVPEKVKHRMMADKDYRQKTMELSATRKQVEQHMAMVAQLAQHAQQMAPYNAQLYAMENRANQLQQALQSRELAADPLEYNRVQSELAILLHTKGQFAQGLEHQQAQFAEYHNQLRAQQLALDAPKLFEQHPELSKPEVQKQLAEYVRTEGLPQEAIDFLNYNAAGVKLAFKARQYDLMVADQAKARAKLKETVKPLPAATQSSRAGDPASAKQKSLRDEWKKSGGRIDDPNFSAYLRGKLRG